MISADIVRGLAHGGLAAALIAGYRPLWLFLIIEAVVGTGSALFGPAISGLLTEISPTEVLKDANVLSGTAQWVGIAIGPALAGLIVLLLGPAYAIVIDAATFFISAFCLASFKSYLSVPAAKHAWGSQIIDGLRELRSRRWLWSIMLQFALYSPLVYAPYYVLGPAVLSHTSWGSAGWGTIVSVQGLGSLLAGVALLKIPARRPLVFAEIALLTWCFPSFVLALRAPLVVIVGAAFLAGAGFGLAGPLWMTALQQHVPRRVISQISGIDSLATMALLPVGYALIGVATNLVGTGTVLMFSAAWMLVSTSSVIAVPSVRQLGMSPPKPLED
jgi:MFS family permease